MELLGYPLPFLLLDAHDVQVQPFDLPEAQRALGALPIVEMQVRGEALPKLLPVYIYRQAPNTSASPSNMLFL